jgi:hypothetical protein
MRVLERTMRLVDGAKEVHLTKDMFTLYPRWPVPLSALYLTSTSPTRHAPRRSRYLPRHNPSQASNDVQCHVGEGHPGNVRKGHAKVCGSSGRWILTSNIS